MCLYQIEFISESPLNGKGIKDNEKRSLKKINTDISRKDENGIPLSAINPKIKDLNGSSEEYNDDHDRAWRMKKQQANGKL